MVLFLTGVILLLLFVLWCSHSVSVDQCEAVKALDEDREKMVKAYEQAASNLLAKNAELEKTQRGLDFLRAHVKESEAEFTKVVKERDGWRRRYEGLEAVAIKTDELFSEVLARNELEPLCPP